MYWQCTGDTPHNGATHKTQLQLDAQRQCSAWNRDRSAHQIEAGSGGPMHHTVIHACPHSDAQARLQHASEDLHPSPAIQIHQAHTMYWQCTGDTPHNGATHKTQLQLDAQRQCSAWNRDRSAHQSGAGSGGPMHHTVIHACPHSEAQARLKHTNKNLHRSQVIQSTRKSRTVAV